MARLVTVSMPPEVYEKGKKASKEAFGSNRAFSTYVQMLINQDCKQRKIK